MFGTNRIVARLDEMLTDAIDGAFTESCYDETELSRLEGKFRQYLTGKELATEQVEKEPIRRKPPWPTSVYIPSSWKKSVMRKRCPMCGRSVSRRRSWSF